MSDKDRLIIFDTTLRDGEQSPGASMNKEEKVRIAKALEKLRVDVIEAGFPIASPGDFQGVQAVARAIRDSTVCALARALDKDIDTAGEALRDAVSGRIHTFIATSPIHMERKLRMTPDQVVDQAVSAVKRARSYTDNVEFSPEDAGRSELDFLCRILEAVIDAGAGTVNIPDTVGYNIPEQFGSLIRQLIERVPNSDKAVFSVHCHNDLGLATANSLAAVMNGARQVECTINGLGERAGNASLEEVVMAVRTRRDLFACDTGLDTPQILSCSRLVSNITGFPVQPNKAIVGANAFAHESGIHQDGVLKSRETYEIMRAQDVGWTENRMVLGKHSGRNAFRARLEELGIVFESQEELNAAFSRFKDLRDLRRGPAGAGDRCQHRHGERADQAGVAEGVLGDGGDAPLRGGPGGGRGRVLRLRRGGRSGGRHLQGHRRHRADGLPAQAVLGQRHHRGHRCPGGGNGAAGEGWSHRQWPGRRHRHRHRLRQGLHQCLQQDPGAAGAAPSPEGRRALTAPAPRR